MKITLATIFYNNYTELKRLIESIPKDTIDYFIGIDGIFKYTQEQHLELPELSDDGSRQLFLTDGSDSKQYVSILVNCENKTEYEKRNRYLEICTNFDDIDCIIIVDTDELFFYEPGYTPEDSWNRFRKNLEFEMRRYPGHNVFGIRYLDEAGTDTYKPRVWVNPAKMRYVYGSHYNYANIETEAKDIEYFKSQNLQYCQQAQAIVKGVTLKHDHSLRSDEYQNRRKEYQKYLVKFESLVQSHKYTQEEAHKIAKENPSSDFQPT